MKDKHLEIIQSILTNLLLIQSAVNNNHPKLDKETLMELVRVEDQLDSLSGYLGD